MYPYWMELDVAGEYVMELAACIHAHRAPLARRLHYLGP